MTLDEIAAQFQSSEELRLAIVRDIGSSTVALFAVFDSKDGECLELAGSGTLLDFGGLHYVLTAAHVWYELLEPAAKIGMTVTDRIDHGFFINRQTVVPAGPLRPAEWTEWGPDVILLRVPPEHLGTLNAYLTFYNPMTDKKDELKQDHIETLVLMGAPKASGKFTRTHAELAINGHFMGDPLYETRGNWDYIDFKVDVSYPGIPGSFGGVSGGGLWKVLIHQLPSTGEIEWIRNLEGMAFYQSARQNGHRVIRCHGEKSILSAIGGLPS